MTSRRSEARALLALARPLAIAQVAGVALPATDALVMGRLGEAALAGGGLGASLLSTATVMIGALFGALGASLARAHREGATVAARAQLASARALALAIGGACAVLVPFARPILGVLGQSDAVSQQASSFLVGAAPALFITPLAAVQRHALAAVGRPGLVAVAWAAAVPLNLALDIVLSRGLGPVPPLGVLGVGVATSVVAGGVVALLELALVRAEPSWSHAWRPASRPMRDILRIGAPITVSVAAEAGAFTLASIVVGRFGGAALAAQQVALQAAAMFFIVPNAIAQAAAVRVGRARGSGSVAAVGLAVRVALATAVVWGASSAVVSALVRSNIVSAFLPSDTTEATAIAARLLLVVAAFQLADSVQVVAAGTLRGLEKTQAAMRWGIAAYFGLAPATGLAAYEITGDGPLGVWIGLACGLGVAAVALSLTNVVELGRLGSAPRL